MCLYSSVNFLRNTLCVNTPCCRHVESTNCSCGFQSSDFLFFPTCSQPLVPRENITAWMNAIGLIITALPVSQYVYLKISSSTERLLTFWSTFQNFFQFAMWRQHLQIPQRAILKATCMLEKYLFLLLQHGRSYEAFCFSVCFQARMKMSESLLFKNVVKFHVCSINYELELQTQNFLEGFWCKSNCLNTCTSFIWMCLYHSLNFLRNILTLCKYTEGCKSNCMQY